MDVDGVMAGSVQGVLHQGDLKRDHACASRGDENKCYSWRVRL